MFLGLKRGLPDHKVAPRPQKWHELAENIQNNIKNTFFFENGPSSSYIGNQQLYFDTALNKFLVAQKVIEYHKVVPQPQKRLELTKNIQNHQKSLLSALVGGPNSCYIGTQPLYLHSLTMA